MAALSEYPHIAVIGDCDNEAARLGRSYWLGRFLVSRRQDVLRAPPLSAEQAFPGRGPQCTQDTTVEQANRIWQPS